MEVMEISLTSVQFVDEGDGNIPRGIFRITLLAEATEISPKKFNFLVVREAMEISYNSAFKCIIPQ